MLIVGAKGHAIEVFDCLLKSGFSELAFYDDINPELLQIFTTYRVYKNYAEVESLFELSNQYILGIGGPVLRKQMVRIFDELGGQLTSVVASTAIVSEYSSYGKGLNIMHNSFVAPNVSIGEGVLLNSGAAIHHDSKIGSYCEISPGAQVLGRCHLGENIVVGSSAVILPDIKIGDNSIIGAGAVVTRDLPMNSKVIGVPARPIPIKTTK